MKALAPVVLLGRALGVLGASELSPSIACIGADIPDGRALTATSSECSDLCDEFSTCMAWTYRWLDHTQGGMCMLKLHCNDMAQDASSTSGQKIKLRQTLASRLLLSNLRTAIHAMTPGSAYLVQTARDTGDRMSRMPNAQFEADYQTSDPIVDVTAWQTSQELVGFGGAFTEASAVNFKAMHGDLQQEFLRRYFDAESGIGYSIGRTHINSCDFSPMPGSWSEDNVPSDDDLLHFDRGLKHDSEAIIPLIKAALRTAKFRGHELKLFASPWSPPAWMKTNHKMVGGGKLKPENAATWANYIAKWISAYKAKGVPFWAITPQNEPGYPAPWEACTYTAQEEADWLGSHLGPTMQAAHPEVLIFPYDHNKNFVYTWARTMYHHANASKYTAGISFHWYSGDHFENVARVHNEFPQALLLASEATWEKSAWGEGATPQEGQWSFGEGYAHDIMGDLNAGAAGWTDWNLLLDTRGGPNHLGNYCDAPMMFDAEKQRLYIHPQYYYVGHFSRFLPPGSRRLLSYVTGSRTHRGPNRHYGTCDEHDGLQGTAFRRPDGIVAAVVLNCGDSAISFKLKDGVRAIRASIPAHGIQTYLFNHTVAWYV